MANIVLAFDPDDGRRLAFMRAAEERVGLFEGLRLGAAGCGSLGVTWAAGPQAPISTDRRADRLSLLWGEAIPGPGPERLDAAALALAWGLERSGTPQPFGGFHAGLLSDGSRRVRLGADLFGLFPIYYWHHGPVLLAGTSPELFRYHPLFRMEVSREGLAGILLTSCLISGKALLTGVRRLAAGHLLDFSMDTGPLEVEQYRLPGPDPALDLSISELVDELAAVLGRTMSRCAPSGEPIGHLLSGGLDSRVLAGFLYRGGVRTVAITRGQPGDLEMRCARRVADALGFEHRPCPESSTDPVGGTRRRVRWEHLANGAFTATDGASLRPAGPLPTRIMSGYGVDLLMPDMKLPRPSGDPWDAYFRLWFSRVNPWGFPPDIVAELLGDPEPVGRVMNALGEQFRAAGPTPARALVAMSLRYQGRFRIGSIPWRLSFESWPSLPILDREFADVVAGMPVVAAGERHLEKELLCRKFPALAALPLDRNSYDSTPLQPRLRYLVAQWMRSKMGLARGQDAPRRRESRYYYRVSDFDGPAWQAVRAAADPFRDKAAGVLQPDVLARLLSPSGIQPGPAARLKGATGTKLLLAFLLWASEHP